MPLEHKERIVRAFEDEEEDYLLVADTLGVNRSTARGIVACYIREGRIQDRPRDGRDNVRVDDASLRYWSSIHANQCIFSRNEQQKV